MKPYARWKYVVLIAVALFGAVYALPNLYGDEPAVQISTRSGDPLPASFEDRVTDALAASDLKSRASGMENLHWVVRLDDETIQLKAAEALKRALGPDYVVALNLAPRTPAWLKALGAQPMALGLDLRGGVHFLLDVDVDAARAKAVTRYLTELPALLRKQDIRYSSRR
ncbi:MAG: protein translocase subunit SecD, partial [Nevskiales bacterium]|nr:protein translocase subunit SecD [Nevskiales bacterium]